MAERIYRNMYRYSATVLRWVDGDTVDLRVDLGFRTWIETRFRLFGVNTPERNEEGWAEATAFCNASLPSGTEITIATMKNPEKYGRWLVVIKMPDDTDFNTILLSEGYAKPFMVS